MESHRLSMNIKCHYEHMMHLLGKRSFLVLRNGWIFIFQVCRPLFVPNEMEVG